MIVEYVEFAKSKLLHRPFLKIRRIAIVWSLKARDENGVESFRFFGEKMETERKYENGNGNGFFMRK